jgi:DNA repair protein RadD
MENFNRLVEEGYLSPLIPRRTNVKIDVSKIPLIGGEFKEKELQDASDKEEITYEAVKEIIQFGQDRKSWLIFGTGVDHCENICSMFQSFGISAACVHSKKSKKENDSIIKDFKNGIFQALINNNKLTTGFDYPSIDLIGMIRPTMSTGLWIQMLGRGTRPSEGKENCLVLDFAGNVERLGPINDPVIPKRGGKGGGEAPIKICFDCGVYNHASVRFCCGCGVEFPFETKIQETSSTKELIKNEPPLVEYYKVDKVIYNLHEKTDSAGNALSPPSIKVTYICNLKSFCEWVCLEHQGFAARKAREWWKQRHEEAAPNTTAEALQRVSQLRTPQKIRVWTNKKFPEVLGYEY